MKILILIGIFLLIIVLLLLIYVLGSSSRSFSPEANWSNVIMMVVTIFTALATLITAIATWKTVDEMKQAREQSSREWLNDAFIKHEADVLLEFRVSYGDAQEAINFFSNKLLSPLRMDINIKEAPTAIKRDMIVKYYNAINKLNDLYNKNQYIFRKHNLEKSIACLTCFLDVVYMLPERDLEYRVKQDEKVKVYQLTEWNKIIWAFSSSAYFVFNPIKNTDDIIQFQNKNMNEEFDRLKGLVSSELIFLTFKLDNLTLYNNGTNQTNLNVRQNKFYQPLSK